MHSHCPDYKADMVGREYTSTSADVFILHMAVCVQASIENKNHYHHNRQPTLKPPAAKKPRTEGKEVEAFTCPCTASSLCGCVCACSDVGGQGARAHTHQQGAQSATHMTFMICVLITG